MHLCIVNNYLESVRLHEISNADLDLLCNSLDLDKTFYMCVLLIFSVCSNGTKIDERLEGSRVVDYGRSGSDAYALHFNLCGGRRPALVGTEKGVQANS
jgi:hypothetical protein